MGKVNLIASLLKRKFLEIGTFFISAFRDTVTYLKIKIVTGSK